MLRAQPPRLLYASLLLLLFLTACAEPAAVDAPNLTWDILQDTTHRLVSVTGFAGPEAVRYDPDQDVYFVSNFNGPGGARDSNGFVSRVTADGQIETLRFMTGTDVHPFHAGRGLFLVADTLWVADADGVHGFHRRTGAHLHFLDFRAFDPGFINDIAQGPDGTLYVTDTGRGRLYQIVGHTPRIAWEDPSLGMPNGITWDGAAERFVLAGWGQDQPVRAWQPGSTQVDTVAAIQGGNSDGIERITGGLLLSTQIDSSLYLIAGGTARRVVALPGRPADLAIDTRRARVAVPYVARNAVDVWALPQE